MTTKFQLPLIAVRNVERSKQFYCDLFDQQITSDFGRNVTFSGGFAIQEKFAWLTGVDEKSVRERSHNLELYFETDDLDAFMRRLDNWPGIELLHGVHTHNWQQRVVRLYDPDKHLIEVGERMEDVVRHCIAEGMSVEETVAVTQHPLEFVLACLQKKKTI